MRSENPGGNKACPKTQNVRTEPVCEHSLHARRKHHIRVRRAQLHQVLVKYCIPRVCSPWDGPVEAELLGTVAVKVDVSHFVRAKKWRKYWGKLPRIFGLMPSPLVGMS